MAMSLLRSKTSSGFQRLLQFGRAGLLARPAVRPERRVPRRPSAEFAVSVKRSARTTWVTSCGKIAVTIWGWSARKFMRRATTRLPLHTIVENPGDSSGCLVSRAKTLPEG